MEEILRVEGLRKTFKISKKQQKIDKTDKKIKVAVDNLSFTSYKGEIFGLLGPNGAGKTTTLRMVATLIHPDQGDFYVNGIDGKKDPMGVRENIGFLTSELKLEEFFTPNYLISFFGELHGMKESEIKERRDYLFERFGINDFAEVKVADMSTGMKQKVSLVVSIVHDPEFIIFDEPTNGLDVITAKVVTDFLVDLKNEGKSIILSTHIFSLVEKLCDRVGIIIDGKMTTVGTLEEVCQGKSLEDRFFEIYEEEERAHE